MRWFRPRGQDRRPIRAALGLRGARLRRAGVGLLSSALSLSGSSLAVIHTGDSIVLAADSKQTHLSADGGTSSACKISPLPGGVVFASVGVRAAIEMASGETSFEAHAVAAEACEGLRDVEDCARAFGVKVRRDYAETLLAGAFGTRPGPAPQELFTSVFAGLADRGLGGVRIRWSALVRPAPLLRGAGTLRGRSERLEPGTSWLMGSARTLEAPEGQAERAFEGGAAVDHARRLIEAEIEANPSEVGPPVDILRITTSGVCWVQVKPECVAGVPRCASE